MPHVRRVDGQDVAGMEWAAGNLLRQDWPYQNVQLQTSAAGNSVAATPEGASPVSS